MLQSVRAVWLLMGASRAQYVLAIMAMVVTTGFLYLIPLIPQAVIDGVLVPSETASRPWVAWPLQALGGADFVAKNLWVPGIAIVVLSSIAGVGTYLRARWSASASESIVRNLRGRLYDHLQRLTCSFYDTARTGDLIQRCTSDVETIRMFLREHVVEIARALIMFFVPLPVMISIDARMTGVAVLLLPVIVAFSALFFMRVRSQFEAADEAEGEMTTTIQENLTGIRVVRAFGRQDHEESRFAERNGAYRQLDNRLYRLLATFWSVSDLLTFVQHVLVVGAGVYWVSRGELTVGTFFYFLTAVGMFMYPLRSMGRILSDLGKATVSMGRLREILEEPVEDAPSLPESLAQPQGEITFEGVTFRYRDDAPPALDSLSLTIPACSTVALMGPSGSGKSTIVNLLLRLYDPEAGVVRFDGHDVRTLDRDALRNQLAVVMQQPFLFSKTVAENLRFARSDAEHDDLVTAAHMADVHDTIDRFDEGYETMVGERGVTLSGGQRQRVALARALLQRPSVLVLDDALSAVDTATETAILDRLRERRGRQTTLLIAHRVSTLALADHIVVLDEGKVVQQGTHASLLAEEGPYADLWRLQNEQRESLSAPSAREAS